MEEAIWTMTAYLDVTCPFRDGIKAHLRTALHFKRKRNLIKVVMSCSLEWSLTVLFAEMPAQVDYKQVISTGRLSVSLTTACPFNKFTLNYELNPSQFRNINWASLTSNELEEGNHYDCHYDWLRHLRREIDAFQFPCLIMSSVSLSDHSD